MQRSTVKRKKKPTNTTAGSVLKKHFGRLPLESLITASRTFPVTSRVDLQQGLEKIFGFQSSGRLFGVHPQYSHETLTFAHLLREGNYPVLVGPLQYDEMDIGETLPARCLKHGLWLASSAGVLFGVLIAPAERFGHNEGVHLEVAVPPGEKGMVMSRDFLDRIERLVTETGSYRGKIVSLEASHNYSGKAGGVKVHRLAPVHRDEVILPEKTLQLLERNVGQFIEQRERLRGLGMAVKKGLLFYGAPGTGKTHTIRYLASQLPNHTTLLVTAEQVGLLDEYFQLARFLQPAMVVIEDVDLIARARDEMRSACEESLLNRLLNEMDGLREDAAVLFVLTTNQPEQLERALSSRPGRIDQAIEFPLPDDDGRRKLVKLYSHGLKVPEILVEAVVRKTNKASAAFIKELMRRTAQFMLLARNDGELSLDHVEAALDEMLFSGGALNVKLLGGAVEQ
ncbi:MAG: cell division protein FtsH [Verrucomicrobia bacterium]|nr:MAG: cell division protein FtsH [Verrucomicrobiota bacterium]